MAYSTPATLASGATLPAATMNTRRDALETVAKPPQIQAYSTGNQSTANNTTAQLTLAATYTIRDMSLATSEVTVTEAGLYLIVVNVDWAINATGLRYVGILVNGTVSREDHKMPNASFVTGQNVPYITTLGATDTVKVNVYQNSGGSLNANQGSRLSICLLSR